MNEKKALIEKATDLALEIFSGASENFIKRVMSQPDVLSQAQKLCESAKEIDYSSPKLLKLKIYVVECLMVAFRDFKTAQPLLVEIESDINTGLPLIPYDEALFKINQGFLEASFCMNLEEAIRHMSVGLSILPNREEYKGEKLRVLTNLAQYYGLRGEHDIAEKFIKEGEVIFNNLNSEGYNSFFLLVWALILNNQGKFEKAEEVLNKAQMHATLSKDYTLMKHFILLQKSHSLIKQGKLKEAWQLLEKCEEKTKFFFKENENTILANVFILKGLVLIYQQKNMSEAFQYLNKALKIYDEVLIGNKNHINKARAYLALGKAHEVNNDHKKALKEYLVSEEIFDIVLKEKKIDDVSDLYKQLALLGAKMKDESIVHKYLTSHIEIFGPVHPRTKEIQKVCAS